MLIAALCFVINLRAQDPVIDSLKLALKQAKHDKVKCTILSELAETASDEEWPVFNERLLVLAEENGKTSDNEITKAFYFKYVATAFNNKAILAQSANDNKNALLYFLKALDVFEEIKEKEGIASTLSNIGILYDLQENGGKAIDYLLKALKIQRELGDKASVAASLDYLGTVYKKIGNIPKAIDMLHQSLKIQEEIKNNEGLTRSLMSIGNLYSAQGDVTKALKYYNNSLEISEKLGNRKNVANALHNISTSYIVLKDYPRAIEFCNKSLKINEEIRDNNGLAADLINLGVIYKDQGDLSNALEYYFKSLKIHEETNKKENIAYSLSYISDVFIIQKKYDKALLYALRNLQISKELGYPENINNAAFMLKRIYKKLNNYKGALEMYELQIQMRDSINNEEIKKASVKKQFQYEYEKQAAADSVKHAEEQKVKNAQLAAQSASLKQERTQRYALYGGLILVIAFSGFVFNRFRVAKKQKVIIQEQKVLVDAAFESLHEKNKEVMDSITYARRIQRALLTPEIYIDRALNKLQNKS